MDRRSQRRCESRFEHARRSGVAELREASDTLKAELSDTGAEAIDRVKQAGMDAADAAREKVKSP